MKRRVLVAFDYALDGKRANRLRAGKIYEIRDEHVDRFEAEGKIEKARVEVVRRLTIEARKPVPARSIPRFDDDGRRLPRRRKPKAE